MYWYELLICGLIHCQLEGWVNNSIQKFEKTKKIEFDGELFNGVTNLLRMCLKKIGSENLDAYNSLVSNIKSLFEKGTIIALEYL
jgi:hypothetical protein